eukprot:7444534-Pyramimonas_sp.AAC.1
MMRRRKRRKRRRSRKRRSQEEDEAPAFHSCSHEPLNSSNILPNFLVMFPSGAAACFLPTPNDVPFVCHVRKYPTQSLSEPALLMKWAF